MLCIIYSFYDYINDTPDVVFNLFPDHLKMKLHFYYLGEVTKHTYIYKLVVIVNIPFAWRMTEKNSLTRFRNTNLKVCNM